MGIWKTVVLLESTLLDVPSVVGWFKPIVLVPVAFLGSMPSDQIEAILAHELAHIRRCDYLINLLQIGIESLLFYHPAVRWLSRAIRDEREDCCDDIAISVAGDKMAYVSALAALARKNLSHPAPALAADGGSLIKRVRRVLGEDQQPDDVRVVIIARQIYVGILLGILLIGTFSAISFTINHSSVTRHVDKLYLTKALVSAAEVGDLTLMRIFIEEGADINLNVDPFGENALFAATKQGQPSAVTLLLQRGASINTQNTSGNSPLDWALATGNFSMAKLLHDNGAQISQPAWAAATDDVVQVRLLINSGALKATDADKMIQSAVSMGNLDVLQSLQKWTGKPVAGRFLVDAASSGNIPMMEYILAHGANIHTDGQSALEQAVFLFDQPKAAQYLLRHGADPNRETHWEKYLLSGAQSANMVRVLLEAGANPNSEDWYGIPLSAAPDAESVRLLVKSGANLHPHLHKGFSLIESVVNYDRRDRADVIQELVKQGAAFDPQRNGAGALALAARRNKVRTMKLLLDMGVSPNAFHNVQFLRTSAMRGAVLGGSIDAVKLLLEQGAGAQGDSRDSMTPSTLALTSGDWDIAVLLHEGGARDVGNLALACASGDLEDVNELIARGTDINRADEAGHTPLFYAMRFGQVDVVRSLLKRGAQLHSDEIIQGNQ